MESATHIDTMRVVNHLFEDVNSADLTDNRLQEAIVYLGIKSNVDEIRESVTTTLQNMEMRRVPFQNINVF